MSPPRTGTQDVERVVAGRYALLETLGSGGMGTVWRAEDRVLGREVALKEIVFPPGVSAEERDLLRERTRREARAAAGLHHPSAITVFDVVEDDGAPFIVMELVEAQTLADVVRTGGPLSPQRAAQVGLAVLDALDAAHRQGILHRDVKPSNVLMCDHDDPAATGRVVLTDFGIATSSGDPSITHTGLLLGSPNYIAPERARGQSPGPASDLWSLGATLFTAVEGRAPFDAGDVLATVTAVAMGERAEMQAAGPLEPVVDGLLQRDPGERFDAATTRRMLREVARGPQTPAPTAAVPVAPAVADRTAVLQVGDLRREVEPDPVEPYPAEPPAAGAAPAPPRPVAVRPSRPTGASARRAPRLALVVAVLLLLGSAVGLGTLLLGSDDDPVTSAAVDAAPETSEAPAGSDAGTGDAAAPEPSAAEPPPSEQPAEPEAPAASGDGPVPPPDGWQGQTGGPGWQVFVPASYAVGSFQGEPEYRQSGTGRTLRVATTGPGGGKDDAVQDRRDQADSFARRYPSYAEIDISRIDYRGYEAADWEFTYAPGGTELHALSRVFVVDGRGYSLFFQTRASDDWEAARAEFERIAQSFVPA